MQNHTENRARSFSVELRTRTDLKSMAMTNGHSEGVVIEGRLGELEQATFLEGLVLEVAGSDGVLRVDLSDDEIQRPKDADEGGR